MITQVLCACDKKELTALEGRENLRIGYARTLGTWKDCEVPGSEAEFSASSDSDDQYTLF